MIIFFNLLYKNFKNWNNLGKIWAYKHYTIALTGKIYKFWVIIIILLYVKNIFIRSYEILHLKTFVTNQACACALRLGSERPMHLSVLNAFTNIDGTSIIFLEVVGARGSKHICVWSQTFSLFKYWWCGKILSNYFKMNGQDFRCSMIELL